MSTHSAHLRATYVQLLAAVLSEGAPVATAAAIADEAMGEVLKRFPELPEQSASGGSPRRRRITDHAYEHGPNACVECGFEREDHDK